jgi:ATP-dependent Clp protease ATP-binding subunit ClpC
MQHLDTNADAAVKLAQSIAYEYGLDYVGTEHILLAILRHNRGAGAAVLRNLGVTESTVASEVQDALDNVSEDTWVFGRLPGSPHFRNVMVLAQDEAAQLESRQIGSEHLLLGLLRESGSTAQRILAKFGVTLEKCRQAVLSESS